MATNTKLVLGKDIPVIRVVNALQTRKTFYLFRERLGAVVASLEGNMEEYSILHHALIVLGTKTLVQVVTDVIQSWISDKKQEATLGALIKALEDNGMNDCAEALEVLKAADGSTEQKIVNLPDVPDGTLPAEDEKLQDRLNKLKE